MRFAIDEKTTFDRFYSKESLSFGENPATELRDFLLTIGYPGRALDLGAGDGRNALFLAGAGYDVTAVDLSQVGLDKLNRVAEMRGLADRMHTVCADVRDFVPSVESFDLVLAVTLFDHLPQEDVASVFSSATVGLKDGGLLFAQSHTIDDPGNAGENDRASELAPMIHHYFDHNELLRLVVDGFHVIWYQERPEEDHSHGKPHHHVFAKVLARKSQGR